MSQRRAAAFSRIVDRWPAAIGAIGDWEEAAQGYSDAEVEEAVGELLLADQGPGVPFRWRFTKALAEAHRNGNGSGSPAQPRKARGSGASFYQSAAFQDPTWRDERGAKMRVLSKDEMPDIWRRQLAEERARYGPKPGDELLDMHEAMRRGLISGTAAEFLRRRAGLGR